MEDKVFLAILTGRMIDCMLKNNYIDIKVEKGVVPRVSDWLQHTSVLTQVLREARESKKDLPVI